MSESPQYRRTDKAIQQALIRLLKVKPYEKITVQDILDETPVTRGTFYHHYHDLDAVAVKLQASLLQAQAEALGTLSASDRADPSMVIRKTYQNNEETVAAILKIHTKTIDYRKMLTDAFRKEYLAQSASPSRELEAEIYASASAALQLALMQKVPEDFDRDYLNELNVNACLRLLGLQDDPAVRTFLLDHLDRG